MFSAQSYQRRLEVSETTFEDEFSEVNWNTVPQIDKDSSKILGDRKMGTLTNEISQYNVANIYTQINVNGKPVRVSPLQYAGFWKYNSNKIDGIPGYIAVDQVSKEAEFIRLEEGMQYSPSSYFSKDLKRYLRTNFPSTLFGTFSFEIDDENNPFWVVPTYKYTTGIGGAKVPTGCITVDPVTGKLKQYDLDEIPEWIDHSIQSSLAVSMIDSWGKYKNGFWNTLFGQKDVKVSTEGYNYVTIGNDVYLYTGITSVAADESNIGFMLVNMRNATAKYFEMPSAEEYSAMDSAKGQVQHLNYTSTFPILIKVEGTPTYFLSLKDAAGLVKMYAFVSVENIQILSVTDSSMGVEYGLKEYKKALKNGGSIIQDKQDSTTIRVNELYTAIIDGNTYYYIVDTNNNLYVACISTGISSLPLVKVGDSLNVEFYESNGYYEITKVDS
ncbi:MAG: CvpA family protein [Clostridia bacterium]|nr:CvpA family protein [Clostridia bacterium]